MGLDRQAFNTEFNLGSAAGFSAAADHGGLCPGLFSGSPYGRPATVKSASSAPGPSAAADEAGATLRS